MIGLNTVLFDFDGTTADTGRGIFNCVKYAARAYGWKIPGDDVLRTFVGPPLHASFKRVFGVSEEEALAAVEKYRELYSTEGLLQFDLYDGITDVIKLLRENGFKTAVATSKPDRFIHTILGSAGIDGLFDYVSAPLDKNGDTSKAQLINRAVEALKAEKSKTVMVGDRRFDIEGAKEAGVKSIGVLWGYGSKDELENAGADYTVSSPGELIRLLLP